LAGQLLAWMLVIQWLAVLVMNAEGKHEKEKNIN
jgi:hypothetical protein